jgi:hypothetical protein
VPQVQGRPQTIAFPPVGDIQANAKGIPLKAKATSGLPIYYEVDVGPVTVQNGLLSLSDLPTNPQYPLVCQVTAYQKGRRSKDPIQPAEPVTVTFKVIAP